MEIELSEFVQARLGSGKLGIAGPKERSSGDHEGKSNRVQSSHFADLLTPVKCFGWR